MNKLDKDFILNNSKFFVDFFMKEDKDLLQLCVNRRIISEKMKTNLENNYNNDKKERYNKLLLKITQRGPMAYDMLKGLCWEHYNEVYQLLRRSKGKHIINESFISIEKNKIKSQPNIITLKPYAEEIYIDTEFKISTKFHEHTKLNTYSMQKKENRGVLFLVNIINYPGDRRNGANFDKKFLLELFNFLNFKIFYYEDITHIVYTTLIKKLMTSHHIENIDCFVLGILTHGNLSHVNFIDGNPINIQDIYKQFNTINCPHLLHKPKIFLFPFCRGDDCDEGVCGIEHDTALSKNSNVKPKNVPTVSDMILCYATAPGYKSHREPEEGSWYIKSLYNTFRENAHDTDFESLLKMIGADTIKYRTSQLTLQTSCYDNMGFNKALFFNPGYYGSS